MSFALSAKPDQYIPPTKTTALAKTVLRSAGSATDAADITADTMDSRPSKYPAKEIQRQLLIEAGIRDVTLGLSFTKWCTSVADIHKTLLELRQTQPALFKKAPGFTAVEPPAPRMTRDVSRRGRKHRRVFDDGTH
jgi:hypothetical protein